VEPVQEELALHAGRKQWFFGDGEMHSWLKKFATGIDFYKHRQPFDAGK